MIIERNIFTKVIKQVNKKTITALVGARQVGKTTLLKEVKKTIKDKSVFLSFEDREVLELFTTDIKAFCERFIKPYKVTLIDEFQYAKQGGKNLKYIYDTFPKSKLFISGSSHAELAIHSLQFLVGRVSIIEVFPLTFREFLAYKNPDDCTLLNNIRKNISFNLILKYFFEYLTFGGYPAIVLEKDIEEKKTQLKDLVTSYLFKEIKDILEYKNIFEFENVLKRLALQDCQLLNKNSFCKHFGIEYKRLGDIFYTLEKTYVTSLTQPFLKNQIKAQIKSPKTVLQDLGFKNCLINNYNELDLRTDKGQIFENFIYNELVRQGIICQFFNEQNRYEVDFVFEKDGFITGIECKSRFNNIKVTNSMKRFINTFQPKRLIVFNENIDGEETFENCKIIFTHYLNIYHLEKL